MFSSSVPLIFLCFLGPLQGENKEQHFLIKVHWIKKQKKKAEHHRDTTSQPLCGLENNLNHHFKWAVCDSEMGERHFNLSVSLVSRSAAVEMKQTWCVCTYSAVRVWVSGISKQCTVVSCWEPSAKYIMLACACLHRFCRLVIQLTQRAV